MSRSRATTTPPSTGTAPAASPVPPQRDDRQIVLVAEGEHAAHFLGIAGPDDGVGHATQAEDVVGSVLAVGSGVAVEHVALRFMLDTKSTFDAAVIRYARDQAQAQAIQESRLYRNLRDALSGTQEYMAVEKLYQLSQEGGFDLIVVDTPPTRRAMDFLSAPRHLTRLLDNPAIRMLVMPSRAYMRPSLCRTGATKGGCEDRWRGNIPRHRALLTGFRGNGDRDPQPSQTSGRTVRRTLDRLRTGRRTPSGCY